MNELEPASLLELILLTESAIDYQIEFWLTVSFATIVDVTTVNANGKVIFGATVYVADEESGDEMTYQIVGEDEADIKINKISFSSPIARALIGKEEGDVAKVETPGGIRLLEIVEVKYV